MSGKSNAIANATAQGYKASLKACSNVAGVACVLTELACPDSWAHGMVLPVRMQGAVSEALEAGLNRLSRAEDDGAFF